MKYLISILAILLISVSAHAAITQSAGTGSVSQSAGIGSVTESSDLTGNYGYESIGASNTNPGIGTIVCARTTIGGNGTIGSMVFYGQWASDSGSEVEFGIYSDNGSGTDPDTLIGNYGAFYDAASSTSKWMTDATIAETISNSPTYLWRCLQFEANAIEYNYDTGGSTPSRSYTGTFGTWPATWPTGSDTENSDRDYSSYLIFE